MDDEFDDDSFVDIPDNTLQELERNACTSTPKPKNEIANARPVQQQQKPRIQTYGSTGLSRSNIGGKSGWKPPQPQRQAQAFKAQLPVQAAPPASAPEPPSSDYGFGDDEDIIDLDGQSPTIPAASDLPTRPRTVTPAPVPARNSRHGSGAPLDPETEAAFAAADAELGAQIPVQWQSAPHLQPKAPDTRAEHDALLARVAALEAEQARLIASEKQAREAALAKQGEISIVRSKQEQAVKEYERRIAAMQKLHTDETTNWKNEIEAGRKERERMSTDNRFLQHDLAQEVEKGKRLTGPGRMRVASNGAAGTPRRSKKATQGLGDGFDDDEVRIVSPSRSREKERSRDKEKEPTPSRAGTKRKRPANDSPVAALSFSQAPAVMNGEKSVSRETSFQSQATINGPAREDTRFEFMQRLLAHSVEPNQERTIEALAKHHLPFDTRRSLAALFMDGLSSATRQGDHDRLPVTAARILLDLWKRALMEKHYAPISLLLDLLRFCLAFEAAATVSSLIEEAVPLATHCVEKVVQTMHWASTNPSWLATDEGKAHSTMVEHIDINEMLDFLLQLAGIASLSGERVETLWRHIDIDALLSMLNKALSISQLTASLQVLSTSVLEASFGPIASDDEDTQKQTKSEKAIVDRLTILLFDKPVPPKEEPAYLDTEILELRIEALKVLKDLCANEYGATLLSNHRTFIGRLVRFLDRQVNSLYDIQPTFGLEALSVSTPDASSTLEPELPSPHDLTIQAIVSSTTILYTLFQHSSSDPKFSILSKLQAVKGGYHKFLSSLTRLAFSEQLVFEAGIPDSVVEAAHTILDEVLSPEEGEAILATVETPRGTRSDGTGIVAGAKRTGEITERNTSLDGADDGSTESEGEGMVEEPG